MIVELKVRKFGEALGFVLPREIARDLNAKPHTVLHLCKTVDGRYYLAAFDRETTQQLRIGRKGICKYRNVLRKLG